MLACFRKTTMQWTKRVLAKSLHTNTGRTGSRPTPHSERLGTVVPHNCYIFLHSHTPPTHQSSRIHSDLRIALQKSASHWGGVVNFSWSPSQILHSQTGSTLEAEIYRATAFSRRGRLDIESVSLEDIAAVDVKLRDHANLDGHSIPNHDPGQQDVHLYVCTHKARDCRCGEHGVEVAKALEEEVHKRDLKDRVHVFETTHVGGHKFAANMLVYPHGDWLGDMRAEHVPGVLDAILERQFIPLQSPHPSPLCPEHWRGRMGLSKAEQLELYSTCSE